MLNAGNHKEMMRRFLSAYCINPLAELINLKCISSRLWRDEFLAENISKK